MILGFAHPALVVPDLEKAREFYERMFGFRVIGTEGWEKNNTRAEKVTGAVNSACKGYYLAGHNCFLEIFEFSEPQPTISTPAQLLPHEPGIRHLAFYVDDVKKEYQRLLDLGGSALGELPDTMDVPCALYCRDPFGNIIELCEVPCSQEEPESLPGVSRNDTYTGDQN